MSKTAIVIVLVVCAVGLLYGFSRKILLATCAITTEEIRRGHGCPLPATWPGEDQFLVFLSPKGQKRLVAVIEGRKDGTVLLNPRHAFGLMRHNYGPIPEVPDMARDDADSLFGTPQSESNDECIYELRTHHPASPKTDDKKVLLGIRFKNDKVREIRVQSSGLGIQTPWREVKREGEEG